MQSFVENVHVAGDWVPPLAHRTGERRREGATYGQFVDRDLQRHLSDTEILPQRVGTPFEVLWLGLARYWRKKKGL